MVSFVLSGGSPLCLRGLEGEKNSVFALLNELTPNLSFNSLDFN